MMNLKKLLTTPFQRSVSKGVILLLFVVATLGFVDASYLTVEHYANQIPPCSIDGCETVLTSEYSKVLGIPVALGGAIYYLAILVLLFGYLDTKKEILLRIALVSTTLGFLSSLYFLILQAFIIEAYCQYCLFSALTSTILFITSITIFRKYKSLS
jgi:uncharacterized membrane protein